MVMHRRVNSPGFLLVFVALSFVEGIFAQSAEPDTKPAAVLELGGAGSWNVKDGRSSFGPDVAVEVTPIEKSLEIEIGVTPFYSRHSTEWDTDVLFKKPWDLTRKLELMVGVGPAWVRSKENGAVANSVAIDAAVDLMFWPSERRRFGWFVEPVYEYNLARGHERSVGISAGLLIAIPRVHGVRSTGQSGLRK